MPPRSAKPFPFRLEFPPELPITARVEEITAAIQAHSVVILAGETGSGKTTQIPKMCLAAGRGTTGRIACTQPRRVAALSVSRRVAEEMGVPWGREVGCKIRFNDETTRDTVVKFLTDGMLLAEVQGDPLLRDYDTLIIDEAHERSLNIDFLLGHLRTLRYKRPELKIVITSATIDTAAFSQAFDDAPIIQVEGRTYPVEVIYAPLDALGSDAAEGDEREAKAEALHYIDGAVEAIERVVRDSTAGDILVFLPSERDIREVRDLLDGRRLRDTELIPLFGRLSNAEQQRVFAPTQRRKIILATNIAETSLTIPGIRFVVDTGLARISRYSPQARTRRLPIEPVSQSSADQRKGRSGRVADGVCIRLYSEKDFLERPRFTQPEIQRANLADVILRLKAFGLGDIERFPFINMPAAKSIRAGYALLEELGALDDASDACAAPPPRTDSDPPTLNAQLSTPPLTRALTPIGRELARLPVDPTVGRMILQARTEKALREVLIIAAGLSVQDPRERPLEKQQQADAAHRRFVHPDSDFLTLLNIWESYHDEFENLSQARLRRFCRDHFLSYTRMREWRDVHAQLLDVLQQRDDFKPTSAFHGIKTIDDQTTSFGTPVYRAIHRSILAGLLGNIAHFDEENANYQATHDRRVNLFPGSVLFRRDEPRKGPLKDPREGPLKDSREGPLKDSREGPLKSEIQNLKSGRPRDAQNKPPKTPRWLMAAEIIETSRLFARTCARLEPAWALDLGAHLVRIAHSEPFWNPGAGRVMVKQRTRLYGLELESRATGYGKIDPLHATEIFIREALVNDTVTFPLDFISHNRTVRENVEALLTRTRDTGYLNLDEAAYRFYAAHLGPDEMPGKVAAHGPARPENFAGPTVAAGDSHLSPPAPLPPISDLQSPISDLPSPISNLKSPISNLPPPISSVPELIDLVRERRAAEPRFLMMTPDDLRDPATLDHDAESFPAALPLDNRALPLNYAYKPGQTDDGVTLDLSIREAEALTPAALDWAVPGHLEAKVEHYLRALPKELRRSFVPLAETAKSLAAQVARRDRLTARRETLVEALSFQIAERFRVAVDPTVWQEKPLPDYLRVRVRIVDDRSRELVASREFSDIGAALAAIHTGQAHIAAAKPAGGRAGTPLPAETPAWRSARALHEKPPASTWTFGDLPDRVLVAEQAGVPVFAFPALTVEADGIALRLAKTAADAQATSPLGLSRLLELGLGRDLGWLQRDLRALRELGPLIATLAPLETLQEHAFASLRRWLCDPVRVVATSAGESSAPRQSVVAANVSEWTGAQSPLALARSYSSAVFAAALAQSRADLLGLVPRVVELLREILTLRQSLQVHPSPYPNLDRDLVALLPPDFLLRTPYAQLAHFPRYLRALKLRADRWRQSPAKDAERAAQLAPYLAALAKLTGAVTPSPRPDAPSRGGGTPPTPAAPALDSLRWLIEEFRVSLFAQELGTAEPVSATKLDRALASLGRAGTPLPAGPSAPTPRPIVTASVPDKKLPPLKDLSVLDKLFRR